MKILFVCLGNICRSPMAEAIFLHLINERSLHDQVVVDSAGTGGWHAGESADPRTIATLAAHGIACSSVARQLTTGNFREFDRLLAMDSSNLREMRAWPGAIPDKVSLFLPYDVPDPYYGGSDGFNRMFDMLMQGCIDLLDEDLAVHRQGL